MAETVKVGKKEYTLLQEPYITGFLDEPPYFRAYAEDAEGETYHVIWDVREDWQVFEDEEDLVKDWDQPSRVERA